MYIVNAGEIRNEANPEELVFKCLAWRDPRIGDSFTKGCFHEGATRNALVSSQKIEQTINQFIVLGFFIRVDETTVRLNSGLSIIAKHIDGNLLSNSDGN